MVVIKPNILITGTPGTGKSKLCAELSLRLSMKWQDVSEIAKKNGFTEGHDDTLDCPILDEDQLMDFLEPEMAVGGNIVEYHGCDFFPERWFAGVFVIQCNNTVLFDRLTARGYSGEKLQQNLQSEIFNVIGEEASESYAEDIVFYLSSETELQYKDNIEQITDFVKNWK